MRAGVYVGRASRGCCACGRRQKTGPAYTCGVDQRKACSELGALGLGVCESDCGRMWDMACSRWRQLHDEESPACGDYTYFVNSDNPRGVAPPATPPPSQRSPDAGPRSAPELPARRRGRLDPGADSRFLTWGDDYSPPQSTR